MRSRPITIGVVAFLWGAAWSDLIFDLFGQAAGQGA